MSPPEFTQTELVTHDFTGYDWRELPYSVVKAARSGAVATWTIVGHRECVSCLRKMWTCDPTREDICEEDEYEQSREVWDLRAERAKHNNMKPVDPFREGDEQPTRTFWPLDKS